MGLPQNHPFFLVGFSMIKHQAIGVLAFSEPPNVILWGQQGAHFANTRTWIPPSLARDQHISTGGPKTIYQSYSHIAQHID